LGSLAGGTHVEPGSSGSVVQPGALGRAAGGVVLATTLPMGGPLAMQGVVKQLERLATSPIRELDYGTRCNIERLAIEVGGLPSGFPRELLHRYIFGNYETLTLSPSDFLKKVAPMASI
jgi:hypothetical protein